MHLKKRYLQLFLMLLSVARDNAALFKHWAAVPRYLATK